MMDRTDFKVIERRDPLHRRTMLVEMKKVKAPVPVPSKKVQVAPKVSISVVEKTIGCFICFFHGFQSPITPPVSTKHLHLGLVKLHEKVTRVRMNLSDPKVKQSTS